MPLNNYLIEKLEKIADETGTVLYLKSDISSDGNFACAFYIPEVDDFVGANIVLDKFNIKSFDTLRNFICDTRAIKSCYATRSKPMIKNVMFNDPATIVFWSDGTKTVVKTCAGDIFDSEKGLAMAISKKYFSNSEGYYGIFKKRLPKQKAYKTDIKNTLDRLTKNISKLRKQVEKLSGSNE